MIAVFVDVNKGGEPENVTKKGTPRQQSNPSSPYSALQQAVTAVGAIDTDAFNTAISVRPGIATATIVLPLVLLRGRLFGYTVGADLKDEIVEVGALLVSVPTDNEDKSTLVAVLTEETGKAVWQSMYVAAHGFCVAALPHARRIASALTMSEQEMEKQL